MTADIEGTQISEREMYHINGLRKTDRVKQDDKQEELIDVLCMYLYTYINGERVNKDKIYDIQTRFSWHLNEKVHFNKAVYVSPVDHVNNRLSLNKILSDSKLYDEMLNILHEFDDNITNINALKDEDNPFSAEYMVLTKNHAKALPLSSYGDGMKKALLLLSSVVLASDGILLLDEFETAIHTSAMDSVFSWLLNSALKQNVQIFMTSHCKEAIEKVLECSADLQPYINVYTLYDYQGNNYVRKMSCEEAINAKDYLGLELR
ncbi:MAG: ATP-binding protein [Clostridiales bacterium]|nr:ATP-binding protein [Clostridiales bacterium]